jgi:hypothetical protein
LAELNIVKAVAVVAAAVVKVGRVIVVVAAAAAIYKSVYSYSSLYSANAY